MKMGLIVPQGWTGEYDGWEPARAWARTIEVARLAEELGFESIWLFDHFHTEPEPTDELTFESFSSLSALAALTTRVRLGHIVICGGFRAPSVVAKTISTMDVISGGRMELGIGAGWKEEEWLAYGFRFPSLKERLDALGDDLEVITRMFGPGRASFQGEHASVAGAINLPKGLQQPRVPIMVGGNGPNRTWRLAARYADELNLDGMLPDDLEKALPVIRSRCEEIGRDPDSLRVSVHAWWDYAESGGPDRVELLRRYRELGMSRTMVLLQRSAGSDVAIKALADDAAAAGAEFSPQ
jgi:F420-dependent oxidoreductase-like protein